MTCEDIRNLALLESFGEAAAADGARVREHAAACPACAAELRALREGMEILKHLPRETPSREAREAIGGLLLREAPRPGRTFPALRFAAAAAVLLACAAGVWAWKAGPAKSGGAVPQEIRVTLRQPEPAAPVDPALAWEPETAQSLDSLSTTLASLAPERATETRNRDLEWFEEDGKDLDDLTDRLDVICAEIDKL